MFQALLIHRKKRRKNITWFTIFHTLHSKKIENKQKLDAAGWLGGLDWTSSHDDRKESAGREHSVFKCLS